jgi:hypothetical protein
MPIPESQLETWSHQGSVQQSSSTYQLIRNALMDEEAGYADKSFDVFLQGSYGNDTNIYSESDVDVVICLDSIFRQDIAELSDQSKQLFNSQYSNATYTYYQFKEAVVQHLRNRFGADAVSVGSKAIKIKPAQGRRSADVVVCYEYRRYKSFSLQNTNDYVPGIIFPASIGEIINYPKRHSSNLTAQHQKVGGMLKPMVRILKNMRSRMSEENKLRNGVAPSYYLEGMFYNVPVEQYVSTSYGDTFVNGINWLLKTDKSKLVCANWQYYLLGSSNVQWTEHDFNTFLAAVCDLWENWD